MAEAPIEKQHSETMNKIAAVLSEVFAGYGFALLVFDMESTDGRMNYISNAERGDMLNAMKEFISNNEFGEHSAQEYKV